MTARGDGLKRSGGHVPVKAGRRLRDRMPPTHAVLGWEAFDSFAAVTSWNLLLVDLEEKSGQKGPQI